MGWGLLAGSLLLALAGCDRGATGERSVAGDPFEALELTRAKTPIPAKPFTVPGLTGQPLSLAEFSRQVVLLNFWATWCLPCREEMPALERLYQRYRDRGFTILAISVDRSPSAVWPFVQQFRLSFPVGLDPEASVAREYGMRALPTTVVIDRAGQIVAGAVGARAWDGPAARQLVEALLSSRTLGRPAGLRAAAGSNPGGRGSSRGPR
jgi:thiol-disulfide isomerase/thioredoxin